jgi:16S rRNA (adenine1518-N6/adenine1519-N6)-dimethyltransferase
MKHVARKRFGQHFLVDHGVIDAIVRAVDPRPGEALVEIGPGLGALTFPLRDRAGQLTVVEFDRDLAARLRRQSGLTVIEADILRTDLKALAQEAGQPLRIVGNLPYNISSPILFHLLEAADQIRDQHLMVQAEVAWRMAAGPGSKTYGRLSVMLQWRYAIEPVLDVPPQAFDPPPAVDSAVVCMRPLQPAPAVDADMLGRLVTCAFSQRRKLLRHTLGPWLSQRGYAGAFDLQRRAEEVPVAAYVALAQEVPNGLPSTGPKL